MKDSRRFAWGALVVASLCAASPVRADVPKVVAPAQAEPDPLVELRKRQEQLNLENNIADLLLRKEMSKLIAEQKRRELESNIAQQKLQVEIATTQAEIERLGRQTEVLNKRLALKDAERRTRLDAELSAVHEKQERLRAANELAGAELQSKARDLSLREQELRVRTIELQAQRGEIDNQLARLATDLELRDKRDLLRNRVKTEIQYTKEPFKNGVLTVSDRRIALNGVITMETAEQLTERINYFNNQSQEFPIFIVIDDSPGGSVAAGYKILKTMSGSKAPVYVVVKTFAASMAAGITTLAARSFAYPNAVILHHQLSYGWMGNMTEQKELLKEQDEWWRRLAAPVAAKMGISLEEFSKRMYQNRSTGDWREFADKARKLHWVDEVVETIREESFVKNPDLFQDRVAPGLPVRRTGYGESGQQGQAMAGAAGAGLPGPSGSPGLREEVDAAGRPYVKLPRLSPVDCYYLYNPDHYYRLSP